LWFDNRTIKVWTANDLLSLVDLQRIWYILQLNLLLICLKTYPTRFLFNLILHFL
jgi:hypothetical protein